MICFKYNQACHFDERENSSISTGFPAGFNSCHPKGPQHMVIAICYPSIKRFPKPPWYWIPWHETGLRENVLQTLCLTLLLVGLLASVSCLFNQTWSRLFIKSSRSTVEGHQRKNLRICSLYDALQFLQNKLASELLHLIQVWLILLVDTWLWVGLQKVEKTFFSSTQP